MIKLKEVGILTLSLSLLDKGGNAAAMQVLVSTYEILRNPEARKQYDIFRAEVHTLLLYFVCGYVVLWCIILLNIRSQEKQSALQRKKGKSCKRRKRSS